MLVRKGSRHHKTWVTHGTAKVHKTALGKKDEVLPILKCVPVHLRLDVGFELAIIFQPLDLDLTVKVTNVTDNCVVLHLDKVLGSEDVLAASSGDKDVALAHTIIHCSHLIALHRCLQSIDGVHLSDDDTAAKPTQRLSRALTDITISRNHSNHNHHNNNDHHNNHNLNNYYLYNDNSHRDSCDDHHSSCHHHGHHGGVPDDRRGGGGGHLQVP